MNISARWGGVLAGALLAGCAGLDAGYVHRDGSRPATVTEIGNSREIVERLSNTCPPAEQGKPYALIRYTGNSHLRWRAFPITAGVDVKVGDSVDLDVNACTFTRKE